MVLTAAHHVFTPRQRRALPGGAHDRLVLVLRWLLPAAALALLAVIIIWPLTSAQEFSFLLAKDKVAMSPDRLRIDNAVYRGETADRKPFEIRAADAVQHSSAIPVVELKGLSAYLAGNDGPAKVTAPAGRYDMDKDVLFVRGPVEVQSADGYALDSGDVSISLRTQRIVTETPVAGRLPMGSFSSDRLHADVSGRVVVLEGHARLRITPVAQLHNAKAAGKGQS